MIIKDLGAVTAYAAAVEKGYTGTEEEYAELMASYATVAEEAAESAESASQSAESASASASTATQKASEATTAAQTATAKAEETQADADAAALDASQALSAASTATTKASEAAQSASDAVTAKTAAQTAQTAAEGSATTAQTAAQTATQKAAEAAESARTLTIDTTLTQSGQAADAKVTGDEIEGVKNALNSVMNGSEIDIQKSLHFEGNLYYGVVDNTLTKTSHANSRAYTIDLKDFVGETVTVFFDSITEGSTRMTVMTNDDDEVKPGQRYYELNYTETGFVFNITAEYPILCISFGSNGVLSAVDVTYNLHNISALYSEIYNAAFYVSTTGNDTNNGTLESPLATVDKALEKGASKVLMLGGVYYQRINLAKAKRQYVEIVNAESDKTVTFIPPYSLIATVAEQVSGKVHKATTDKTILSEWIYQDGVPDPSTLISNDRHPLQRGYAYRCGDTKIEKCTSDNLSDAITEIQNYDGYKWYKDGNDIYFSTPEAVSYSKQLRFPTGARLFSGNNKQITLFVSGIDCKYMAINLNDLAYAKCVSCKAVNVYDDGSFIYDHTITELIKCEAARCRKLTNGDGINAHSENTGDAFAHQTEILMTDCWSHDNYDDGWSSHNRSEAEIWGGLYEYNGKAGITPSYGCHAVCYNVMSRQNYSGFMYIGETHITEGGTGGQMVCIDCIADSNNRGGSKTGFIANNQNNEIVCYNCKAINNDTGFACYSSANLTIVDCTQVGSNLAKSGRVVVKNTQAIV